MTPSGECTAVISEETSSGRQDTTILISSESLLAFLETTGDGTSTYREDLTEFVISNS
jgi:hypothetical protein